MNLQVINFDSFHVNLLNQLYFLKAVSSTNLGKSSDITQGVPLLRRYFDVPKNSILHLFLKQTFQKYNRYIWNKIHSSSNQFIESHPQKDVSFIKYFSFRVRSVNSNVSHQQRNFKQAFLNAHFVDYPTRFTD